MAKKKNNEVLEEVIEENISTQPLEEVMGDRYATYAKYVIQDRAIPDVRDGLKPVQRRIIFSMYKNGNTINKPTKKCAHTVGAVMGTYHPHGDTSIYEALARMSQDWKLRYPLIDFQGNNGSIDGDKPAAYRYTESRLSMLSNELVDGIDKNTVDMQLNFDDTEFEPVVLPSRFPNLLVNGSEGIAVAIATEIPPHNLREVIEACIYRVNHKNVTVADLRQFVLGPDFPTGGVIYRSSGIDEIYETGRGRIEIAGKCEIIENKDNKQIVISEVPYKIVKINLVHEIDLIRHSKSIDGIVEVRDESDYKGIRVVVDLKKEAKADLILAYLMKHTSLRTSYTTNMVAICNGSPKTLNLLDYVDAYLAHQKDVITRETKFDLDKCEKRLHIVEGLIIASLNINEVVEIIKKSKDKADSKVNLINRFNLSNDQAEAIVMMPLYKLSHTDELLLKKEEEQLNKEIERLKGILEDENKLNRVLVKDLKEIADKYGDERRTEIIDKGEETVLNKRDLIAKEEVVIAITRDGYAKRCSVKSYKGSGEGALPGIKSGDVLVAKGYAETTDYIFLFTNKGNYTCVPVYKLSETRWKDEGVHLNNMVTFTFGEKIIKAIIIKEFRNDLYLALISRYGQIKRIALSSLDHTPRSRPSKCMKLLANDEIAGIQVLSGNSDILVLTSDGNVSLFNENDLTVLGLKAGGVKSISNLKSQTITTILSFNNDKRGKIILVTNKGCQRVFNVDRVNKTARLGKVTSAFSSFKNDVHKLVGVARIPQRAEEVTLNVLFEDNTMKEITISDFTIADTINAKKNMDVPNKLLIEGLVDTEIDVIDKNTISRQNEVVIVKEEEEESEENVNVEEVVNRFNEEVNSDEETHVEQISIFDEFDDE